MVRERRTAADIPLRHILLSLNHPRKLGKYTSREPSCGSDWFLVGRALDYLPYFIYSFEEIGQRGLGAGRGKAALQRVIALGSEPSDDRCIYQTGTGQLEQDYPVGVGAPDTEAVGTRLRLRLHTPLRLKNEGRYTHRLDFSLLVRALLRRTSDLARFHCGAELDLDYRQWIERAAGVSVVATTLRWHDWERYSQRQDRRMKLGGLVGEAEFAGEWQPLPTAVAAGRRSARG